MLAIALLLAQISGEVVLRLGLAQHRRRNAGAMGHGHRRHEDLLLGEQRARLSVRLAQQQLGGAGLGHGHRWKVHEPGRHPRRSARAHGWNHQHRLGLVPRHARLRQHEHRPRRPVGHRQRRVRAVIDTDRRWTYLSIPSTESSRSITSTASTFPSIRCPSRSRPGSLPTWRQPCRRWALPSTSASPRRSTTRARAIDFIGP
jgi:hypothetical protein